MSISWAVKMSFKFSYREYLIAIFMLIFLTMGFLLLFSKTVPPSLDLVYSNSFNCVNQHLSWLLAKSFYTASHTSMSCLILPTKVMREKVYVTAQERTNIINRFKKMYGTITPIPFNKIKSATSAYSTYKIKLQIIKSFPSLKTNQTR